MANRLYTITVRLDTTVSPPLTYSGFGPGGETISSKRHRVFKNDLVEWICPDGNLVIAFIDPLVGHAKPVLTAPRGTATSRLKIKGSNRTARKYLAAIETPAGSGGGVFEDPILEDGGDPGGGLGRKKPAKKKAAKKSAKKTKKR